MISFLLVCEFTKSFYSIPKKVQAFFKVKYVRLLTLSLCLLLECVTSGKLIYLILSSVFTFAFLQTKIL